ncbi:hypothetical protein TDB9533_03253 [Thalassocella blandensis]|nr:hypothetical protein TDB9533_03253 [Thalassocella blandensis]
MKITELRFEFNWKLTLFSVLLLPILIFLGTWQLDRADQKRAIQAQWEREQSLPPQVFQAIDVEQRDFRRVTMRGEFQTEKYWLKENQMLNGQLGFHVIMPFKLDEGDTVVAVDRGWVEGSPLREFVPKVITPEGSIEISGALVLPSDSMLVREADVSAKTWPHKILEVDLPVLSSQIKQKLYPLLLRIDADSTGALTVYWRPINVSPAKHIGYAVQWFLMALALVILYLYASTNIMQIIGKR